MEFDFSFRLPSSGGHEKKKNSTSTSEVVWLSSRGADHYAREPRVLFAFRNPTNRIASIARCPVVVGGGGRRGRVFASLARTRGLFALPLFFRTCGARRGGAAPRPNASASTPTLFGLRPHFPHANALFETSFRINPSGALDRIHGAGKNNIVLAARKYIIEIFLTCVVLSLHSSSPTLNPTISKHQKHSLALVSACTTRSSRGVSRTASTRSGGRTWSRRRRR